MLLSGALLRLQGTTPPIPPRGAFVLLVGLLALAGTFGLEATRGAALARAFIQVVDRHEGMTRSRCGDHRVIQLRKQLVKCKREGPSSLEQIERQLIQLLLDGT